MNDLRPVLAWHEKARLLMERWEREMAVSAWPSDASTGRMTAPKRSRRKLGPLPSTCQCRLTFNSVTYLPGEWTTFR